MSLELQKAVPNFIAQATADTQVELAQLQGKQVVIYFYPKDNTPGCTTEGQEFRDAYPEFQAANTVVFGVSRDSLRTHENFKAKHGFPFELISDPEETLCQQFAVIKLKKLYGKEYLGIERSTFLIDANGVLQHEWRKVKVKGHVAEVLAAAQQLNQAS
ncbi:peroxiredoxin [Thiopseudomonas alkaliphila]|uniref:thioredoxin-dependent peroxiredoxin n=1 Tax=Thiopseudomonas alkaliphila TaxID=1697053 RepID=A0A0K1XCK7_9GAMM|nr:peroxiredoxin [Thiopseudomonas alkaliphila]AKX44433.1 peroxiredoxin [Thiopseudomonas alkaliphila]AKX46622.1 peroxiredoxin [Thiopseudomonas alkaliphila]AKX49727.1 peroxiredoxin [Thiopseudomonas alkaliphila]AKX52385.1 peroxiredoxin [Thiopseudomonas alkaliphila]AKX54746.1 peroxiredoxin [Thiopseudomonas alkaliphila]